MVIEGRGAKFAGFFTGFGALCFFWVHLHIFYDVGAPQVGGRYPFNTLQYWILQPGETNYVSIAFMVIGFLFSAFLSIMRVHFIWWGFPPVGYIVSNLKWEMRNFWFCMLISSTAKWLILKYNGPKGYRKAVKFSVGLVLGDFITGGFWNPDVATPRFIGVDEWTKCKGQSWLRKSQRQSKRRRHNMQEKLILFLWIILSTLQINH